ncbi:VOC family protein [Actinokineospora auranticolor]|uniref:Putative enzyme related to lactoylglutathione lyase n=1 Tax=Actinokineospora auranticolor TaxID=155976 RepID=A0A2S6GQG3_9PSEU|nr:VOC family protein [Actinokineospora auranticolor]PPK67420.1 putative enzyme related to lactoylglutathione lyase [Actinokineospora auranticolor]
MTADLIMFNLDCRDPQAQAAFYARVLGWAVSHSEPAYSMIGNGSVSVGFGQVEGYVPAAWPDASSSKRYHFDLSVPDVAAAADEYVALGASRPEFQPGGDRWTVLLDPEGQPFCLCPAG